MTRRTIKMLLLAGAVTLSPAVRSHHSGAMFDQSRKGSVSGVVRTLEWVNPHVWMSVDVHNEQGTTSYGFEGVSILEMARRADWQRDSVNPGDHVTVEYLPFRFEGRSGGKLLRVRLASGKVLSLQP